jgi:putative molybdopterin biosynthesis protein
MQTRVLLRDLRTARGLSVAELAKSVGVSRQTVYAIEDGSFIPSTAIALRLARVLGTSVEDIFTLDVQRDSKPVKAELLSSKPVDVKSDQLVRVCRVNERLIAFPVSPFPAYLPAADGIISGTAGRHVMLNAAIESQPARNQLVLAGCDPALSLLADELQHFGVEIITVPCSSRRALDWLKHDRVTIAGSHLLDAASGDYNVPLVRRHLPKKRIRIVTFATWEQGLVVRRGNPKGIRSISDLAAKGLTLINREKGSGSRDLLDKGLREAGLRTSFVNGYKSIADGHLAAAYAVAVGDADCCIATRSAARCFGLDFVPLAVERFDLSLSAGSLDSPATKALLDLLTTARFRKKLEAIAGYDMAQTGKVLA